MPDLNGKVVFVTGASKGIGRAISEVFATNGATVVCASRTVADLEIVAHNIKENGGTAIVQQLDVSNMKDFQNRSEERRVGKEGRSRWSPYH